jgi:hypothetical protein
MECPNNLWISRVVLSYVELLLLLPVHTIVHFLFFLVLRVNLIRPTLRNASRCIGPVLVKLFPLGARMNVRLCNVARRPLLKVQVPRGSEQHELIKESGDVTELPVSVRPGRLASGVKMFVSNSRSDLQLSLSSLRHCQNSMNATDCDVCFIVIFTRRFHAGETS